MTKGNNSSGVGGFQHWDPERQRNVASNGGRAAHASGNAHKWTKEEASAASKKGHANRKAKKAGLNIDSKGNAQFGGTVAADALIKPAQPAVQTRKSSGLSSWPGTVDSSDGSAY
jgi:hypothetical protein